jgi:hypothetical protein
VIGQAAAAEALRAERGQLEARIVERTAALNEQMTRTRSALAQAEGAALDARVSEQQAALALAGSRRYEFPRRNWTSITTSSHVAIILKTAMSRWLSTASSRSGTLDGSLAKLV